MASDADASPVDSGWSSHRRPPLPIASLREKIVEKIQQNRVTLIVGETGCGKSSQVPLFLLEENIQPILCTQPRRFAVVTIARMVAKARNCEVGGEVGYHIGHANVTNITSVRSRLIFKTAGVLLEQMRDRGLAALKYKVIVLDEVHERSVESDLVLACVKQFMMRSNELRVVLMSATADIARYRDYFRDLGRGERVEVIAIPSVSQQHIFQREVLYLEQVTKLLGRPKDSESLSSFCSGTYNHVDADLQPQVYSLIHRLILHIHENEPDTEKSILVFLPTYYALEKQWHLLKPLSSFFKVHILHSSIDTDQALLTMKIWKSHRKVILATNIAESSVTIPGVAFVIDSCRSLQVLWDPRTKNDTAELVWVSKSQAEQRKGRTGRTCDGLIYRLVTRTFYNSLDDYEHAAILRLSLRQQVLMICCAESKAINDPKAMLQKVLDPPEPETVEEALDLLLHIHALERPLTHRARYEPTFYGRLLDSLPLSFDASVLALKFGAIGLLREGILISTLMDIQPLPIVQPFGNPTLAAKHVDNYFKVDPEVDLQAGKKETVIIGNLCAFQFWQHVFKDKHRLERLKEIIKGNEPKTSQSLMAKLEEEWCSLHSILKTSLHNVSEIYEDAISVLHRFRPASLAVHKPHACLEPNALKHTCILQSELGQEMDSLTLDDDNPDLVSDKRECLAIPYVTSSDFQAITLREKLTLLVKELRLQYTTETIWNHGETVEVVAPETAEVALCRYFINGLCTRGSQCFFSHTVQAKRPICKFFLTYKGCRNGASCLFSHDYGSSTAAVATPIVYSEEDEACSAYSFLQLLPASGCGRVLVLNDKDMRFTCNLLNHYDPAKIIVTTPHPCSSELPDTLNNVKIAWNVSNPCKSIIETKGDDHIPWKEVRSVLWFVDNDEDNSNIRHHLSRSFKFLAIRILSEASYDMQVIVTMNNVRFAQLQVEKLARECFFYLARSFPFDENTFGKFLDPIVITRPMQVCAPFSYVFNMCPPVDVQTGNYAAEFRKLVYCNGR